MAETVEEQIVRHLTEKRINELNQSIAETKEEYLALKKEIELIEQGEMDERLNEMWQEVQSELATKESSDGGRKKHGAASKTKSPNKEPAKGKGQKSSPSGGRGGQEGKGKRATADSKKARKAAEDRDHKKEAAKKEASREDEAMEVSPELTPVSSAAATPEGLMTSGGLWARATPHLSTSLGGGLITDESPLPRSITIPKEEVFGESLIGLSVPLQAGTPTSSECPAPNFASDIHIIVQQPNVALVNVGTPLSTSTPAMPLPPTGTSLLSKNVVSTSVASTSAEGSTMPSTVSPVVMTPTAVTEPPQAKPTGAARLVPPDHTAYLELVRKLAAATTSLTQAASPTLVSAGEGPLRTQAQVPVGGVAKGDPRLQATPPVSLSQLPTSASEGPKLPSASEALGVSPHGPLVAMVTMPPPVTHTVMATVLASTPLPPPASIVAAPPTPALAEGRASIEEPKPRYMYVHVHVCCVLYSGTLLTLLGP